MSRVRSVSGDILKGVEELGEIHAPYHNFMGPGTKIVDRLSLNYTGKKGTKNYFIPTTYSDLVSFEHDLMYWSPTSSVKAWSDSDYLKDIRSVIGLIGISAQYLKRYGLASIYTYGSALTALQGIESIAKDLNTIKQGIEQGRTAREQEMTLRQISRTLREMEELEGKTGIRSDLDLTYERMSSMERGEAPLAQQIQSASQELNAVTDRIRNTIIKRFLPKLLVTGYMVAPKIVDGVKDVYSSIVKWGFKNPEYEEVKEKVDNVRNKYERYLTEIGDFEDAPFYRSLIKSVEKPEGEKFFKVKKDFDRERARELYIDFYNEFVDYQKYMNNKYKDVSNYTPFEIKELNAENLKNVYNIESVPSSLIEDVYERLFKNVSDEKGKYTNEEQEKIKSLNNEIEKVLKREQDVPYETINIDFEMPEIKDTKEDKIKIEFEIPEISTTTDVPATEEGDEEEAIDDKLNIDFDMP